MIHNEPHPSAGNTVTLSPKRDGPDIKNGDEYQVEDYWDRVSGGSWMTAGGNPGYIWPREHYDTTDTAAEMEHGHWETGSVSDQLDHATRIRSATPGQPADGPYPATVDELASEVAAWIRNAEKGARGLGEAIVAAITQQPGETPE